MAQAPNRLYSRAEIRHLLRKRVWELSNAVEAHAKSAHHPVNVKTGYGCLTCFSCCEFNGQILALRQMILYFGGRHG